MIKKYLKILCGNHVIKNTKTLLPFQNYQKKDTKVRNTGLLMVF